MAKSGTFYRSLNSRFRVFLDKLEEFKTTLIGSHQQNKANACRDVASSLRDLMDILDSSDRPNWALKLHQDLQRAVDNPSGQTMQAVLNDLLEHHKEIVNQTWSESDEPEVFDVDAAYQIIYEQSKIPQLFEDLLRQLQSLIDSNLIDSNRAIESLEKLIATIRKGMRGSYLKALYSVDFIKKVAGRTLKGWFEEATDLPGIKSVVKAFFQTLDELTVEIVRVDDELKRRMEEAASIEAPLIEDHRRRFLTLPAPGMGVYVDDGSERTPLVDG